MSTALRSIHLATKWKRFAEPFLLRERNALLRDELDELDDPSWHPRNVCKNSSLTLMEKTIHAESYGSNLLCVLLRSHIVRRATRGVSLTSCVW